MHPDTVITVESSVQKTVLYVCGGVHREVVAAARFVIVSVTALGSKTPIVRPVLKVEICSLLTRLL